MATASNRAFVKPPDCLVNHFRLVGYLFDRDADRKILDDLGHRLFERFAEGEQVAARLHADREPDRRLSVEAEERSRRIDIAAGDGGDVRQREEAVVYPEIDPAQGVFGDEAPADAQGNAFRSCLDKAGLGDGVLRLQRGDDVGAVDAEGGDLAGGEFEVDHLVLRTDDVDLADVRDLEDLRSRVLREIAQFPMTEPVAGEGKDIAVDIPELVIEERTDHALGELVLYIVDQVAHPRPGGLHILRIRTRQQIDEDDRLTGGRDAAGMFEIVEFLQLLFDAVGNLLGHFLGRGAGPLGLDDHRLDREGWIFFAAESHIGIGARHGEDDHEIPDERAMLERPVRKIEFIHGRGSCSSFTFCPSASSLTPAMTTSSPSRSPDRTRTERAPAAGLSSWTGLVA